MSNQNQFCWSRLWPLFCSRRPQTQRSQSMRRRRPQGKHYHPRSWSVLAQSTTLLSVAREQGVHVSGHRRAATIFCGGRFIQQVPVLLQVAAAEKSPQHGQKELSTVFYPLPSCFCRRTADGALVRAAFPHGRASVFCFQLPSRSR